MNQERTAREYTNAHTKTALKTWEKAPAHVRAMAGTWVNPLILAISAMDNELQELSEAVTALGGVKHG